MTTDTMETDRRPLILVTNDDGILAPGVDILARAAARVGRVIVVAPECEMSAVSHAITLHQPLRVRQMGEGRFALNGTPVDCTYMGIHHIAGERPDLVVSGVNLGPNLGTDVLYSGTVAGAREGTLQGIPSVAFSLVSRDPARLEGLEDVIVPVLRSTLANGVPRGVTLNVNIPSHRAARVVYRTTTLGRRPYSAEVVRRLDPRGHEYLWIGGTLPELEDIPGTDTAAVRAGAIAVTPIPFFEVRDAHIATLGTWELFEDVHQQTQTAG